MNHFITFDIVLNIYILNENEDLRGVKCNIAIGPVN